MATIMYPSLQKSQSMRSKRKSAVELLAESKAFYVKSETVRDSQQALPLRMGSSCVHSGSGRSKPPSVMLSHQPQSGWRPLSMPQCKSSVCVLSTSAGSRPLTQLVPCIADMAVSPSRSLPPLRVTSRRSTSACSDVLQNKLRKLLNGDSRENMSSAACSDDRLIDDFIPISPPAEYAITERSSYRYAQNCSPEQRVVHKSLPDLHNNSANHGSHAVHGGVRESCSNKSTSNKSLSNRDSGESSGHYTHRSEPAPTVCTRAPEEPRPEVRRDSGSSTQHSGTSMYPPCCDSRTTRQGYPPPPGLTQQDDRYRVPPYDYTGGGGGMPYQDPTLSPGPGTFKRQKCFRYKQRERSNDSRPILRSKSDISDRYWRCGSLPRERDRDRKGDSQPPVSHLEQFFEQLGLNSDSYESMLMDNSCDPTSPVYFSDVSTVDSSRPIDNVDYCSSAPPFRPSEPPSIVERNARIIKWLCNCRKLQISNS